MKAFVTAASVALLAALGAAAPASARDGAEVSVRRAAARMVVIVENRTDVAVEIEDGSADLPRPSVTRVGNEIRIDGGLGRNPIRNCHGGADNARQPGEGASVELRGHGRVELSAAPLIVIRTPPRVDVNIEGDAAVFGFVGRGATSVELGNAGCGDWTVANVAGPLEVSLVGSGSIRAGSSESVSASLAGSGDILVGPTNSLEANIAGSGDVSAATVHGSVEASIAGSGNVRVRSGDVGTVEANIVGSGDVEIAGRAASVEASVMGSGDVRVAAVQGSVSQSVMGSGRVRIGN
ncbi:GIN domain-containing protein [Brevundimonas sp.]|uniref:GIN domain-containing protein n=1 Tax=Brevundimonas sp. TaxID=1871086 RepID=UPI003D13D55B